ncbi:MAG TPA: ROK family protein [Opitutaceae bacterium]|nr:ROK family protein [Opitutaceae bacterium]
MLPSLRTDPRIVLTLDAGGSSFRFFATQGGRTILESPPAPSHGDDLPKCLDVLINGFSAMRARCATPPVAISFAFPGPADYPNGVIRDLPNLPAFRGGVPLGPILEAKFGLPVFINNDGQLFAYGEAVGGFLPEINDALARSGSRKRYRNLLGVTLGTGFGGGIVRNGHLVPGDNGGAGEVWLLRNKLDPALNAEEGVSIRAVRRVYAERAGIAPAAAPDPKTINQIARGETAGNRPAALEAFRRLGEVAGDAIAQSLTQVDGLVVIGGGLSKAADLFMPALIAAVNDVYLKPGGPLRRFGPEVLNLEDPTQRAKFLRGSHAEIPGPGTARKVWFEQAPLSGIGLSRLGTSEAITLGAYAFALLALAERA